ncbi:MAG: PIN domain-containing protein [Planctomycetota bacterium]|jgi:uncharacterized protein YacL
MLSWIFRSIFIVVIAAVLFMHLTADAISGDSRSFWTVFWCGLGMTVFAFLLDVLTPKKRLLALAGVFFGLLVGMIVSVVLAPLVDMMASSYRIGVQDEAVAAVKWLLGICVCFIVISIVVRTKDDVRFVIPYVEFAKQTKGLRPLILDTSAIIDGRIADLYQSKLFDAPLVVPRFVLNELQLIADSADKLKRNRGRRGLDILNKMQTSPAIDIGIDDAPVPEIEEVKGVDQKLIVFAKHCNGRLATTDYNLTKVAQVREVDVVNINDLANSLKVVALPGESMEIKIIKPGEEADQGIGYLPDGTMVVVEGGRDKIGRELVISWPGIGHQYNKFTADIRRKNDFRKIRRIRPTQGHRRPSRAP